MQEPSTIFAISMNWFRLWQSFARGLTTEEPGPVNNTSIAAQTSDTQPIRNVRPGSDYAQIDENLWRFFNGIYGGGPEIVLRGSPQGQEKMARRQKEQEKEQFLSGRFGGVRGGPDGQEEDGEEDGDDEEPIVEVRKDRLRLK